MTSPSPSHDSGAAGARQTALRFLQALHDDEDLRKQLEKSSVAEGLAPVVALAVQAGFDVTEDSLADAFPYDWLFARIFYQAL